MQPYSDMRLGPGGDPVWALLAAYREADLWAAIEFEALRGQQLPACLCWNGSQNTFRRKLKLFILNF